MNTSAKYEPALRLVYPNDNLSFSELLELDNSFTMNQINFQVNEAEMFKVKHNLSSEIMIEVFDSRKQCYTFCSWTSQFRRKNIKTTYYVIQPVRFLGPKIWVMVSQNSKHWKFLQEFKRLIKV